MRLDPLVVTGTRTVQRLGEAPIRTEVIGSMDFRLSGATCLADAVELLPGLRVENNCQNCGTSEVLLLGLEQKYTQLLFDGAPLFSGLAGVYGIEQVPTVFLDRIEVVKGGGSAVYGSGAVGGVINLIGRRPVRSGGLAEFRHDLVKGQPSTLASVAADFVSAGGGMQVTVYGQQARTAEVDLNHDGFSDLTRRRLAVGGARLTGRLGAGELRLDYSRTTEFRRGGNKFELPDNLADISERVDSARDALGLAWTGRVAGGYDYLLAAGYARIHRQTFYGGLFGRAADATLAPESFPGAGDNDQAFIDRGYRTAGEIAVDQFGDTRNSVWNLEAQVNREWGRHLTSAGVQYYREWIADEIPVSPFVDGYPADAATGEGTNLGAFFQDDWKVGGRWQLVSGLRVDRNSELAAAVFSPRVSVKWTRDDTLTIRATFGAGFRAPQAFDEDLHIELIAGNRTRTVQAPELRPEKSRSILLGGEFKPRFADGRLAVEANAFLTTIRGTFTNSEVRIDPVAGTPFRQRYNGPGAEVGGIEINIGSLPLPKLRVDVGGVVQFARFTTPVVIHDDGAGRTVRERDFLETPRRYAVLQLAYLEPRFADFSISATYTGRMKDINQRTGELNARTPDFLVWNAGLARRFAPPGFPAFTASLGIKNAFDSRQSDLEAGVNRDPYYLYGPRTPRTVFGGVRLEF
jgi:outer membrane receptor for ferrienterochelin and colicins